MGLKYSSIKPVSKMLGIKMNRVKFEILKDVEMLTMKIQEDKRND